MSSIELTSEQLAEAARLSEAAVRDMAASIPELPLGIDAVINEAIEQMRSEAKGSPEAMAISLPLYRQLMRLGALVAISVIAERGDEG